MFKNVKKFFVLLCILNFFSCKAMDDNKFNDFLNKKDPIKQFSGLIMGAAFSLLTKGAVNLLCKAVPVSIKPWIDNMQCSLSIGTKGKELKLSNNIYTSLFALYVSSKARNSAPYKLEMALGFFVISPSITTIYHYMTRTKDKNLQK